MILRRSRRNLENIAKKQKYSTTSASTIQHKIKMSGQLWHGSQSIARIKKWRIANILKRYDLSNVTVYHTFPYLVKSYLNIILSISRQFNKGQIEKNDNKNKTFGSKYCHFIAFIQMVGNKFIFILYYIPILSLFYRRSVFGRE